MIDSFVERSFAGKPMANVLSERALAFLLAWLRVRTEDIEPSIPSEERLLMLPLGRGTFSPFHLKVPFRRIVVIYCLFAFPILLFNPHPSRNACNSWMFRAG